MTTRGSISSIRSQQSSLTSKDDRSMKCCSVSSFGSTPPCFIATLNEKSNRKLTWSGRDSLDKDEDILVGKEREIHDACRRGNVEDVKQLIIIGTHIDCRNKHWRTPLHWAAGNGHTNILKLLLKKGAEIDASDMFGMNALLWASWFGQKLCVQTLIGEGAQLTASNKQGWDWVHCAIHNNHLNVIELINETMHHFDLSNLDRDGQSYLQVSITCKNAKLAKAFVQSQCNVKFKDEKGNSPLHLAAKYGLREIITVLIDAGCDLKSTNNEGKTVLHVAAEIGNNEFCREILKHNLDVNSKTPDETCSLHLAVLGSHVLTVQELIEHRADLDVGNKHNQTPLHLAVMSANMDVINLLIQAGANTNIRDDRGETALHLVCESGLIDIADVILLANPDLNVKDIHGNMPIDIAARGNYVILVDMLIKAERYYNYRHAQKTAFDMRSDDFNNLMFKSDAKTNTLHFKVLLYQLASKHLKRGEWKRLAFYWGFTNKQLQMIEEQYTGSKSFKEHGHRIMLIWFQECTYTKQNPVKNLLEGLIAIKRSDLADLIRIKVCQAAPNKNCCIF